MGGFMRLKRGVSDRHGQNGLATMPAYVLKTRPNTGGPSILVGPDLEREGAVHKMAPNRKARYCRAAGEMWQATCKRLLLRELIMSWTLLLIENVGYGCVSTVSVSTKYKHGKKDSFDYCRERDPIVAKERKLRERKISHRVMCKTALRQPATSLTGHLPAPASGPQSHPRRPGRRRHPGPRTPAHSAMRSFLSAAGDWKTQQGSP